MRLREWCRSVFGFDALLPMAAADRARLHRAASGLRIAIIVTLLGALIALSLDRPLWLLVAVALWMLFGVAVTLWTMRRHGAIPPNIWFRDVVWLSAMSTIVPELLVPGLLCTLAILTFTALTARRQSLVVMMVVAVVGVAIPAAVDGSGPSIVALVFFPISAFAVIMPALVSSTSLQRSHEINERISDELGLCLWETEERPGEPSVANYLYGNTERLLGQPSSIVMTNAGWESLLHPDDRHTGSIIDESIHAGRSYSVRYRQRAADGGYRWVEEVGHVEVDTVGVPVKVRGMTHDVTRLVATTEHSEDLDSLVDALATAVGVLRLEDPDDPLSLVIVWQNDAGRRMTGDIPPNTKLYDILPELFDLEHHQGIGYVMAEVALGKRAATLRDGHLDRGGRMRNLSMMISPLTDRRVAICADDRTELQATRIELERLAYSDGLTGLPNRLRFREQLASVPVGVHVVEIDIDHFDDINDAFGHACGDEVIVELARILSDGPGGSTLARIGGDEFGFYVEPGAFHRADIGPRILNALSRPITLPNGLTLQVSASIGITTKAKAGVSVDELLRQADVATNRAKRMRSHVETYDPRNDTSAPHRMMLLGEMRRAIRNHELELHFHPMIECATGRTCRMEGLLRWRHPALGLLPPSDFIEMTEMSNLNPSVVRYTVEAAIAQAAAWRDEGRPMPISVNVGGTTMHDEGLVATIVELVEASGLPRHTFGLELAERQLVLASEITEINLQRLADAGVWLSIDDFGAATSSLLALRKVPAHELKIDKSYVDDLRRGDSSMIGAIVTMALNVGLQVVAEGVEDELSLRWLRANGVAVAQGYLFGKPAPVAEFAGPWIDWQLPVAR
jgi:diguanylate cyclase (GGDEF)-like protein